MEADAAVGVASRRAIFEVAANGGEGGGELAADLMVAPGVQVNFHQGVAVGLSDLAIVEQGLLGTVHLFVVGVSLVLFLIFDQPMGQFCCGCCAGLLEVGRCQDGMVGFVHLARAEHLVEAGERLAGACKYDNAADGAVQSVDGAQKDGAGFGVFGFDVGFYVFTQGSVSCFVPLYDFASSFVDDDDMVVFVEYLHGF